MTKKQAAEPDEDEDTRRAVKGDDARDADDPDADDPDAVDADDDQAAADKKAPSKVASTKAGGTPATKSALPKKAASKSSKDGRPAKGGKDKKKPESKTRKFGRDLLSLAIFLGVALSARASLADHYVVPTGSMIPTVEEGDRVFVSKAAYGFRIPLSATWLARWGEPQRGDVVVLQSPLEDVVLLKRVVAVGGDEVRVQGGRLILNGKPVISTDTEEELGGKSHRFSLKSGGGPDFGPEQVPKGKVLVMGDNRGNSKDGRMFGFVDESAVLGRAVSIYLRDGSLVWDKL